MDYKALGLIITPDFISIEEEQEIINNIKKSNKATKNKGRNTIQRFGSKLPYNSNMVSLQIPTFFDKYSKRLVEQGLLPILPDSVTVNEYFKGQDISPHIDSKSSGKVSSVIGLKSTAIMRFNKSKEFFSIDFPPRCLVQLSGEIRTIWNHSIEPVPDTRYSIVFRCSNWV